MLCDSELRLRRFEGRILPRRGVREASQRISAVDTKAVKRGHVMMRTVSADAVGGIMGKIVAKNNSISMSRQFASQCSEYSSKHDRLITWILG
jgi:hypothetical protein